MANLTIKGLPDEIYERLKKSADRHRRSINQEAIVRLQLALGRERASVEEILEQAKKLRKRLTVATPLTDSLLRERKDEGRP